MYYVIYDAQLDELHYPEVYHYTSKKEALETFGQQLMDESKEFERYFGDFESAFEAYEYEIRLFDPKTSTYSGLPLGTQ
jgi:hypothetical protein